ncbi:uncharacterized protein Fot_11279 [Forsythia ovata]|uniref:Uncharacterized protein n=1 Tax=Forsythia ovata TaxID=205694 RepID=A0ABD1WJ88_9LAMI
MDQTQIQLDLISALRGWHSIDWPVDQSLKKVASLPEDSSGTDTEFEQISKFRTNQDGIDISSSLSSRITKQNKQNGKPKEGDQNDAGLKENPPEDSDKHTVSDHETNKKINEHGSSSIECRCLDKVDLLGMMVISTRGRYLINWPVSALMNLQHPNRLDKAFLVTIYGPKVKFD